MSTNSNNSSKSNNSANSNNSIAAIKADLLSSKPFERTCVSELGAGSDRGSGTTLHVDAPFRRDPQRGPSSSTPACPSSSPAAPPLPAAPAASCPCAACAHALPARPPTGGPRALHRHALPPRQRRLRCRQRPLLRDGMFSMVILFNRSR